MHHQLLICHLYHNHKNHKKENKLKLQHFSKIYCKEILELDVKQSFKELNSNLNVF